MALMFQVFTIPLAILLLATSLTHAEELSAHEKTDVQPSGQGTFYSQLSVSSWQETFQLSSPGSEVDLISTPLGFCPGLGYRKHFAPDWSWDANGCVFLGTADLGVSSTLSNSNLTYTTTRSNFVLGLQSSVGILWEGLSKKHQFGVGVPLVLSHESFNNAAVGTISSATQVQTGVLLETRFYSSGNLCIDPKLAWFQTSHNLLWSLNFGLDL
jgi:hypothetical protein